ncbi:MAG: 2-oxo acid dehydrogenase subunit E2 [Bacteroidota bacterium]
MADLIDIRLPAEVGENAESLVVMWYKEAGDSFEQDEILVEVQTDKAIFEMPAEFEGVMVEILVQRGEVAAVGQIMAKARKAGAVQEDAMASQKEAQIKEVQASSTSTTPTIIKATPLAKKLAREHKVDLKEVKASGTAGKITDKDVLAFLDKQAETRDDSEQKQQTKFKATPLARKVAKEHNIDLAMLSGSGQGGKITDKDVRTYMETLNTYLGTDLKVSDGQEFEEVANSPIRKATAKQMFASLQNSAQLTLCRYVEVSELKEKRKELMPEASWNDWLLKATCMALIKHKDMNAAWEDDTKRKRFSSVNLGMAVDTESGLLVPVIHDAHNLSFKDLIQKAKEQQQKALANKLKMADLKGGTFTLTNLGGLGIQFFTPILNPPQVGILGIGRLHSYLDIVDNRLKRKWQLPLSITFDHRALDGAPAASFLQSIEDLLAEPESLL